MKAQIQPRRFNAAEFHRMTAAGIFREDDRIELLQGEIIEMTPIGPRHAACVMRLTTLLGRTIGNRNFLSVQNPVQLDDDNELYPDITILRPRAEDYNQALPRPADVLLLIEVADTSLESDRNLKIPEYARAGIPEVWLVDIVNSQVFAYAGPTTSGYGSIQQIGAGELQSSQAPDSPYTGQRNLCVA